MPRVGDDPELGLRPCAVKLPRGHHRTDDVVATLHDYGRDVTDLSDAIDELGVAFEEALVDEVMALDARERERKLIFGGARHVVRIHSKVTRRRLPDAPRLCSSRALSFVFARQPRVIRTNEVTAFVRQNGLYILFPRVRKKLARPPLIEPSQL